MGNVTDDELRELIREANGAAKDLRQAVREARAEVTKLVGDEVDGSVKQALEFIVATRTDQAVQKIMAAVRHAEDAIQNRFAKIAKQIFDINRNGVDLTLEDLVKIRAVVVANQNGDESRVRFVDVTDLVDGEY